MKMVFTSAPLLKLWWRKTHFRQTRQVAETVESCLDCHLFDFDKLYDLFGSPGVENALRPRNQQRVTYDQIDVEHRHRDPLKVGEAKPLFLRHSHRDSPIFGATLLGGIIRRRKLFTVILRAVRYAPKLTEKDTIVLRQGLSAQLEQSPFLRLISDECEAQTLARMSRPNDSRNIINRWLLSTNQCELNLVGLRPELAAFTNKEP